VHRTLRIWLATLGCILILPAARTGAAGGAARATSMATSGKAPTIGEFLSPAYPFELVSAKKRDPESVSYQSSAIAAIDKWKSPVLLVHGDDDRNVAFSQTTGLVQLLRAHDVYYELIVNPDDTHETLLHRRWLDTFGRMQDFLRRFVRSESEKRVTEGK